MRRSRIPTAAIAAAAAMFGTIAMSAQALQRAATPSLPETLWRAAIKPRDDRTGMVAGAQIGLTNVYVVYLKTAKGCGSGGCRAQIWKRNGDRFDRGESLPVGHLPITVLPRIVHGMPVLGVTVYEKARGRPSVLQVAYDGQDYTQQLDDGSAAETAGDPLITSRMLQRF